MQIEWVVVLAICIVLTVINIVAIIMARGVKSTDNYSSTASTIYSGILNRRIDVLEKQRREASIIGFNNGYLTAVEDGDKQTAKADIIRESMTHEGWQNVV